MDYKEKYEMALEKAREWYNKTEPDSYTCIVESIFPELKESEDEKIRKELITNCRNTRCVTEEGAERIAKWIAWLENQDESISLPEFTFDDILALQCCMETVKKVQEDKDLYEKLNNLHSKVYDAYHLEKQGEQKPAWSKEDEKMFIGLTTIVEDWYNSQSKKEKEYYGDCGYSNWLQSIKQRKTWKPSKEQIRALRWVLNNIPYNTHKEEISGLLEQIKDL